MTIEHHGKENTVAVGARIHTVTHVLLEDAGEDFDPKWLAMDGVPVIGSKVRISEGLFLVFDVRWEDWEGQGLHVPVVVLGRRVEQ